jgi:hypothetical protein
VADPKKLADALTQDQLLAQFNRREGEAQPWYMKPMDMEGRATFLPFKDTLPGSVMNQRELALPGLLAGAVNAFTAPSRVSTQGFDAPEEALNLATNVFGGGITTGKMMRNPTGVGGKDLAMNVVHDVINPQGIVPPHNVRDVAKKEKLTENMEKNGWVGRPILVFDAGRGNEALTGSHRIAAAKQAGIEIPIYKIDENIGNYADKNGNTIFDAANFEQKDIVKFLREFGDKDAAKLMNEEIKANNKADKRKELLRQEFDKLDK